MAGRQQSPEDGRSRLIASLSTDLRGLGRSRDDKDDNPAAAAAVWSSILIAAGATFRDAPHNSPQATTQDDFDERWLPIKKGDRLPAPAPTPFAVTAAQSEVVPPLALPREWLLLATDDDIRQAEAEHHRHRDICRHGRTYFTIQHHQYWRCKV